MIPSELNPSRDLAVRADDLVRGALRQFTAPPIVTAVYRLAGDPGSPVNAIAAAIDRDAALSARLVAVANSPFYGSHSRVITLSRAISVIGHRGLGDLVLALSTPAHFAQFGGSLPDRQAFWAHGLHCGLIARLLGLRCGLSGTETLFAAGLLHDIGQFVILEKLPEIGRQTRMRAKDSHVPLHLLEKAIIGCDHADTGGELLGSWKLSADLEEAVRCHHAPTTARRATLNAAIIHLADQLADEWATPDEIDWQAVVIRLEDAVAAPVRDLLALDERTLREFREEARIQFQAMAPLLPAD